ncbi:MAG: tetratricopeptide repeat protein [Butyrivibrio sp.]|nr:tetratricopeptide repeat protein [Butyrivibrio sp.]
MKKTPLRYIFLLIFSLAICVAGASIVVRVLVNRSFVKNYNSGVYDAKYEEKLLFLNFPESYVPYYNLGNMCYKNLNYPEAVGYYNEALKMHPPAAKECSIRINLALALCNTIDFTDLSSQDKIDMALFVLYQARDTLLENGWAVDEGDNYRDKDAQQLKEDIDKMIEKLKNPESQDEPDQNQDNNEPKENDSNENSGNTSKQNRQQEELERNKEDAMKERQEERRSTEEERRNKQKNGGGGSGEDPSGGEDGGSGQENIKRW